MKTFSEGRFCAGWVPVLGEIGLVCIFLVVLLLAGCESQSARDAKMAALVKSIAPQTVQLGRDYQATVDRFRQILPEKRKQIRDCVQFLQNVADSGKIGQYVKVAEYAAQGMSTCNQVNVAAANESMLRTQVLAENLKNMPTIGQSSGEPPSELSMQLMEMQGRGSEEYSQVVKMTSKAMIEFGAYLRAVFEFGSEDARRAAYSGLQKVLAQEKPPTKLLADIISVAAKHEKSGDNKKLLKSMSSTLQSLSRSQVK